MTTRAGDLSGIKDRAERPEDAHIRRHYPGGGALAVDPYVDRSREWIRHRARFLGIRVRDTKQVASLAGLMARRELDMDPHNAAIAKLLRDWRRPYQLIGYQSPRRRPLGWVENQITDPL